MSKRLNTRISKLESSGGGATAGSGLSLPAKKMLIEIVARVHALFWGWRWQLNHQPPICELRQRQREYLAGVAGVLAKAVGQGDWKQASENRQELIYAGLLLGIGSAGQISSVIVTPKGEGVARALIGDRLSDGWRGYIMMLLAGNGPIREQFLLNHPCEGDPADWDHLAEPLLPLLVQGVVRATSDTCGRLIYCLTGVEPQEPINAGLPEESWADELYVATWRQERSHLANVEPRDHAEVFIPIGNCDCWPADFKGETDE